MKIKARLHSRAGLEIKRGGSRFPSLGSCEFKLKRILVPVDFSELSRKALDYAVSFAEQFNAEILLFHVIEILPPAPEFPMAGATSYDAQSQKYAERQLGKWRKAAAEVTASAKVRIGIPHHEIIATAKEENIGLIIMGVGGRSGLARFLLGSTAERVVRRAPCPVMVVRERERDFINFREEQALSQSEPKNEEDQNVSTQITRKG